MRGNRGGENWRWRVIEVMDGGGGGWTIALTKVQCQKGR